MKRVGQKENIIIAGAGYGGIRCALTLESLLKKHNLLSKYNIILVDKNRTHIYTPSLYVIALGEEPARNVAFPLSLIFKKKNVNVIHSSINRIDKNSKQVILEDGNILNYQYLVLALGSVSNDYNIPGIKEYAYSLKSMDEALKIRNRLLELFSSSSKEVNIVIGGGGFSGTEISGEILFQRAKRHNKALNLSIVTGSPLLTEFGKKFSYEINNRLKEKGANIILNEHIASVDERRAVLTSGKVIPFDMLIWTGGVKGSPLLKEAGFAVDKSGYVLVNDNLQVTGEDHIFAVGDNRSFLDLDKNNNCPRVCDSAIFQGRKAAVNIYRLISGLSVQRYQHIDAGQIVPVSGRYAYVNLGLFHYKGWLGWLSQQIILGAYLSSIFPFPVMVKRWNKYEHDLKNK